MKTIKKLWIRFITWLKQLFSKKTITDIIKPIEKSISPRYTNPRTPSHNNRKRTKGRHIQIDPTTKRSIYHGAK